MNTHDIINKISEIRVKNNENWMAILRIAIEYAPYRTKEVMKKITENDTRINTLTKLLCKAKEKK